MVNKVASCRVCVVEVEGRENLAPACATPAAEGMKVTTNSRRVLRARRKILELLLSDHPFNCLVCAKSTNCELQTLAYEFGINQRPYKGEESTYVIDTTSKALKRDPDKCIMCRRCETMCNEVQTVGVLTGFGRGFHSIVGPARSWGPALRRRWPRGWESPLPRLRSDRPGRTFRGVSRRLPRPRSRLHSSTGGTWTGGRNAAGMRRSL